jgi:hypothetical protein
MLANQMKGTALLADDNSEERKKLVAERDELADREWLAGIEDDVIAEIGRRQGDRCTAKGVEGYLHGACDNEEPRSGRAPCDQYSWITDIRERQEKVKITENCDNLRELGCGHRSVG